MKFARTSDVARPRLLALSALGAGLGVAIAAYAGGTPIDPVRPILRPHAKLACATCHQETVAIEVTCKNCHGAGHASTRRPHRALAAKGELTCPTCHGQHTGANGVTFTDDAAIRWAPGAEVVLPKRVGIPKGTSVPLVAIARCTKCHDPARAGNPVSACGTGTSGCFDEHVKLGEPHISDPKAPCAKQHGSNRFVAWEAAREIATTTPWIAPAEREGMPWLPITGALAGAIAFAGAASAFERRNRQKAEPKKVVPAERKRLPTINTATCLGCYACVDACPFDVLTVEKYIAVVARPEECCGVVLCEQVCPNGSLQITDGEPILDRPATDDLESRDVPGLYIAGDLTGLPLIKNAINQGVHAIDRIAATLPRKRGPLDVIVVGAGPAGLSAALRAKEKGLSCVVLEQATVAASIKSFPRDKIVHDPPLDLPVEGELWLKQATKEELLAQWTRIVRARALDVREGQRVEDIAREGDGFVVRTAAGEHRAARVVLAIGRRGTARRVDDLVIEAGTEDRVAYALADARSFEGKRVVVVGLGDSAMEAAIALARQPGTTVTISYRGKKFARGKAKNIAEVQSLVEKKKLRVWFETSPVSFSQTSLILAGPSGRRTVGADAVLVLIGGVPSWDLLTRAGIVRRELFARSSV